jgi:hypothetical protein
LDRIKRVNNAFTVFRIKVEAAINTPGNTLDDNARNIIKDANTELDTELEQIKFDYKDLR